MEEMIQDRPLKAMEESNKPSCNRERQLDCHHAVGSHFLPSSLERVQEFKLKSVHKFVLSYTHTHTHTNTSHTLISSLFTAVFQEQQAKGVQGLVPIPRQTEHTRDYRNISFCSQQKPSASRGTSLMLEMQPCKAGGILLHQPRGKHGTSVWWSCYMLPQAQG